MSLSGILASVPKHKTVLPVTGKKVEYRPFVVKEEKILMMAAESKDEATMTNAVREVISACTNGEIDVMKLPTIDMEYLFLQLRSHSVGETVKPNILCSKCQLPTEVDINLKDIKPTKSPDHNKTIRLVSDISVQMKYPTMEDVENLEGENDMERTINLLCCCIEKVYQGDTVYNASEMSTSEVRTFVDEMTQDQFKKVFSFLETMPKLEHQVKFTCKNCKHENETVLKGISSFFS